MKKRVYRSFIPTPRNQERLRLVDDLGLNVSQLINEVLEQHLKHHIEAKSKKLREALSVPVP